MPSIAHLLLDHQIVLLSPLDPFTWTSGIKSPVYCDNRLITGIPEAREQVLRAFEEKIANKNIDFDVIAGVATGSISWAAFLAERLGKPMIFVRGKVKGHGTKKQVEGFVEEGKKMLVIEDLFSTGGSSIDAAEALKREKKADVVGIMAIMSWGLPILRENFERAGIPYWSLTNGEELIETAAERGEINAEEKAAVTRFFQNPRDWQ